VGERRDPPRLPDGAPADLQQFLACTRLSVDVDLSTTSWFPRPSIVPRGVEPSVTARSTGTDRAEVSVGWGLLSLTLPISITNGALSIDTSAIPDIGGMRSGIDRWVRRLNDSLAANGRRFEHLEVRGRTVRVTKTVVAGSAQAAGRTPTGRPAVPPRAPTPPALPPPRRTPAFVILGVAALAVGAVALVRSGDDDGAAGTPTSPPAVTSSPAAPATPTSPPAATPTPQPTPQTTASTAVSVDTVPVTGGTAVPVVCADLPSPFGAGDPWAQVPDTSCDAPPADLWASTAPQAGLLPTFVFDPIVGISHDGSVPDAVTGESGPSETTYRALVLDPVAASSGAAGSTLEVQTDCGGQILTGRSPVIAGAVTEVHHPLFQFGPCTVEHVVYQSAVGAWSLPIEFGDRGAFDVTATPVATGQIALDTGSLSPGSLAPAWTILSVLGDSWLDAGCGAIVAAPAMALPGMPCGNTGTAWVYALAEGDPSLLVHGAGHEVGLLDALFGDPIFPCGAGHVGLTVCPSGAEPLDAPELVVVSTVFASAWPLQPDGSTVEIRFAGSDPGGQSATVRLHGGTGDDGWIVDGDGPTDARVIIRDNSVTFAIPRSELPADPLSYEITVTRAGRTVTQPSSPVLGVLQLPAGTGVETPEEFFAELSASIAGGDLQFALDRLHPAVTTAYTLDECRASLLARVDPDYVISVVSVGSTAAYTYAPPDRPSSTVPETLTVMVMLPSSTTPVAAHIALVDGTYRWFTACV